MFAEAMMKGLAAGGWVIGFVTAVGCFIWLGWVIIQAMASLLGEIEDRTTKKEERSK